MNKIERIKMVKAMELIVRNLNDEEILFAWLAEGVADGDIEYGDLGVGTDDEDEFEYYIRDDDFANLMGLFIRLMKFASKSGGLYCDGVVSKD